MHTHNKTKIVATIGPASESVETLSTLLKAGLNVARLNFSHGDYAEHQVRLDNIREASEKTGKPIAILQDLAGPKIRTSDFVDGAITLEKGKPIVLVPGNSDAGTAERFGISYDKLADEVAVGHRICINDGSQLVRVSAIENGEVHCVVETGGTIKSRRGVNLPDSFLSLPACTEKDERDVREFGVPNNVDFFALSFVQTADDILRLRKILDETGSKAKIIAKIETTHALAHLDDIIAAADGIMVARGDLAVEIGPERVPFEQKDMINRCKIAAKPVIVATQMLESMITAPTPTRAEVSDVANAILDGTDAIMLSAETAVGDYPVHVVETMARIAVTTESRMNYEKRVRREYAYSDTIQMQDAIARYVAKVALDLNAVAIVAFTETGTTARMISRLRPKQPMLAISPSDNTLRQLGLTFGVQATHHVTLDGRTNIVDLTRTRILEEGLGKAGDTVVVASGSIFGNPGETNTLTVVTV